MSEGIKLHPSWRGPLQPEFDSPYMQQLRSFLVAEKAAGKRIFPKGSEWFRALDLTPLDDVRVVILAGSLSWGRAGARTVLLGAAGRPDSPQPRQYPQGT